jgi:hypothetical protein
MRRTLSLILATALLLSGLAIAAFEIIPAETLRPFVLFGALVMIIAGAAWLLDEFVLPRGRS